MRLRPQDRLYRSSRPEAKITSISVKTRHRQTEIGRRGQTLTERPLSGWQRPPTRTFTAFGGSSKDTSMYRSPLLAGSRVRYYSIRRQTVQHASRLTNTLLYSLRVCTTCAAYLHERIDRPLGHVKIRRAKKGSLVHRGTRIY